MSVDATIKVTPDHLERAILAREMPGYSIRQSCPLANALKDHFGSDNVTVGNIMAGVDRLTCYMNDQAQIISELFTTRQYDGIRELVPLEIPFHFE